MNENDSHLFQLSPIIRFSAKAIDGVNISFFFCTLPIKKREDKIKSPIQ